MKIALAASPFRRSVWRGLLVAFLATVGICCVALGAETPDEAGGVVVPPPSDAPRVLVASVDSAIQPVVAEYLLDALDRADREGVSLLVIQLSTPGGLLSSTRTITSAMLSARTPVAVYVYPDGAQAASAGFFLLMAGDVAAMAPATNTGAAHPVGGQGEDVEGHLGKKIEEDAAATIRSLAERRGRDAKLAESAVLESRSFSAQEALDLALVDMVVSSTEGLIREVDGRVVRRGSGEITLVTKGAVIERFEMSRFQRFRSVLVDPNVVAILLSLGSLGLLIELYNPGAIVPGVVGAICLIVGLYGVSVLPINFAGVALLGLAVLLFIAEIKVQSFGLLTLAGVVCVGLGASMLFRSADPALRVSLQVAIGLAVVFAVVTGALSFLVYRVHRSRPATGRDGLIGERGVVRSAIGELPSRLGKVVVHGEIWNAEAASPIAVGREVRVVAVEGLRVRVVDQEAANQSPGEAR